MRKLFHKIKAFFYSRRKVDALGKREIERRFREQGYSRADAKRLASTSKHL